MNISEKLSQMGMVRLSKTENINGFTDVVTFVIPERVRKILETNLNLKHKPDIVIIRNGEVILKGDTIIGKEAYGQGLCYSLARYDHYKRKFKIIEDSDGKKIKGKKGSKITYKTDEGDLFTAEKYSTKKSQN